MQCGQIRKMLINYALDDARMTERLCVDVHTSHCSACRQELEDVCELIVACDGALSHPCPADDFDTLMARIEAGEAPARDIPAGVRWNWRTVATRAAAAAAAVVAVILIAAPVARNAGHVVRELQEVTSDRGVPQGDRVLVPVISEAFVKRVLEINEGYEAVHWMQSSMTADPRLP
jgi:anti-sigma factor RsiW